MTNEQFEEIIDAIRMIGYRETDYNSIECLRDISRHLADISDSLAAIAKRYVDGE